MNTNNEIAAIFYKIAYLLQLDQDEEKDLRQFFKIRAYTNAAEVIENLSEDLQTIYKSQGIKGLIDIRSIGKAIALKIEEYLQTRKIQYFDDLKSKIRINVDEFYNLNGIGIGPKTIKKLYKHLGIKSIADLENAATAGKISMVKGFSKKKEADILQKITALQNHGKKRYLLGDIYPLAKTIETKLTKHNDVKKATIAGSFRRMKETVGDIDFLVVSNNPTDVIRYFTSLPQVEEIIAVGSTKVFVRLTNGIDADLLVVPEPSFGSSLQYFTGNKMHNIELRKIAIARNYRLNEWGLFDRKNKHIAGLTEEEIYHKLKCVWIPPEMRENKGEIDLARRAFKKDKSQFKIFPQLVEYDSIKGDLQVHTTASDGTSSIQNMSIAAMEFGLDYIAITDHTKSLKIANGLDENRLLRQMDEIKEVNQKINDDYADTKFRILSSAEVEILKDGSLDISNNVLDNLDIVGASIHSNFQLSPDVQTDRLIKAAKNPHVDILFHPTGRLINKREGYNPNIEKVIQVARDTKTVLEINSHYNRLDLNDDYIRIAIRNKVKLVINSDSHHPVHFSFLNLGIGQARRAWANTSDIINTLPLDKMLKQLK